MQHIVSVVYAFSDPHAQRVTAEYAQYGNLHEYIIRYPKITKKGIWGSWQKFKHYRKLMLSGVRKAVQDHGKPDRIHVHVAFPAAIAALDIKKLYDVPAVLTEHWSGYLPEDGAYHGFLMKYYTIRLVTACSAISVVSEPHQRAMEQHGLRGNYSLLNNAVNTGIFQYSFQKSRKRKQLLHVSSLVEREKNISGLLQIMLKLSSEYTLLVIGDGPERNRHEALAIQLGIESRVKFMGSANSNQIAAAMQESAALLLPSHFEGMPVVISEALCCGLPVVAHDVGHISKMISSEDGVAIEKYNATDFISAIELCVSWNEQQREAIAQRAHEIYSYHAVLQELNKLYAW
jgi:glycosyltransferase involved in cell wall biosynthesis